MIGSIAWTVKTDKVVFLDSGATSTFCVACKIYIIQRVPLTLCQLRAQTNRKIVLVLRK